MRANIKLLLYPLLIILFLSGCSIGKNDGDIFQFKGGFVGDNSAVGNIANQLLGSEHLSGFELETEEQPYGIILNYNWLGVEQEYKEAVIYNATFLFSLVQNADWVLFKFDNWDYKITRENLEKWYGKNLDDYKSENELKKSIEDNLKDEYKVKQLFNE